MYKEPMAAALVAMVLALLQYYIIVTPSLVTVSVPSLFSASNGKGLVVSSNLKNFL